MKRCPICLSAAEMPPPDGDMAVCRCGSCGTFALTGSAKAMLDKHALPLNRERLSEAVRDLCNRAIPAVPRIDPAVMATLIGLSAL